MKKSTALVIGLIGGIILISCCILACCGSLVTISTEVAQTRARDVSRRASVSDLRVAIETFSTDYGKYPEKSNFLVFKDSIAIQPSPEISAINPDYQVKLSGPSSVSSNVSRTGTIYAYRYNKTTKQYWLGVKLETDTTEGSPWYFVGELTRPYGYVPTDADKLTFE